MVDTISSESRSRNMAAIRSRDTKPEIYLRKRLFAEGYRYRKNSKTVRGHPDIYLAKYHTVIFMNGCFWHRHQNCKYAYLPKSRTDFWSKKFSYNITRDAELKNALLKSGYKYLVVWECTIRRMRKSEDFTNDVIDRISSFLKNDIRYLEI